MSADNPRCGSSIHVAGLEPNELRFLKKHGYATVAQLLHAIRSAERNKCSETLAAMAPRAVKAGASRILATIPSAQLKELEGVSFAMPRPGIAGPSRANGSITAMRARCHAQRREAAARVRKLIAAKAMPTAFMLYDYMTEVGDQGCLGSCTGWGSTANREFLSQVGQLAPLFAYALAKQRDGCPHLEGSWQHFCFEGMADIGHLSEWRYPYTDDPTSLPVDEFAREAADLRTDGFADLMLDEGDMSLMPHLLRAIVSGVASEDIGPQPVSVSLALYESWNSPSTALYGLATVPFEWEALLGGHAMCIDGYIDGSDPNGLYDTDYFVVKNSWGQEWASQNPLDVATRGVASSHKFAGHALIPAQYFARSDLLWEAIVCLAEPSPIKSGGILDLLRAAWDPASVRVPRPARSLIASGV